MLSKLALRNFYIWEVRKMYVNSEQVLDSVFLSYDKILKKLHLLELTTKQGRNNGIRFKKSNRCYVRKTSDL